MKFLAEMNTSATVPALENRYEAVRKSLRETADEITNESWFALEEKLEAALYQLS
jgi:hypothetical protein